MAVNPNTDFSAGAVLTASQQNRFPRGILGYSSLTTQFNTAATHTTYQDTGSSASISYAANRMIAIYYSTHGIPIGGVQGINYKLMRGSTVIKYFETPSTFYPNTANAVTFTLSALIVGPATAGTETFKMQVAAASNNTQVIDYGSANLPRYFWVVDLGPA